MKATPNRKILKEPTRGSYLLSLIAINMFKYKISYSSLSSIEKVLNRYEARIQLSTSLDSSLRNKI